MTISNLETSSKPGFIVAVDGPAASGKSSVSRSIAKKYGWSWLSTGAFYRGLGFVAHQLGVDPTNEVQLVELASSPKWKVQMSSEKTSVWFNSNEITDFIKHESVGALASQISSLPKVREALLSAQRQCAIGVQGLVAEGRDCGTVIFPSAAVKIYLTASADDRAARRAIEEGRSVNETLLMQKERDHLDSSRKAAPLQAAADAKIIDTSTLNLEQVIHIVSELVEAAWQKHQGANLKRS